MKCHFIIDLSTLKDKTEEANTAFSKGKKGLYTGFHSVFGKEKASKRVMYLTFTLGILGCSQIVEVSQSFWGSSTRALENAREDALKKDFICEYYDCFQAVTQIIETHKLTLFINDLYKNHMVVMNIPGNVDTTEVGIFFTEIGSGKVRIEISSLSSSAKRRMARILFPELEKRFESPEPS